MTSDINFEEPSQLQIVKFGIKKFDELCNGGVIKNSVITLSGFPGTGRSTFAMQFLVEGASKFDENGIYIIFEDSADSALSQLSQYKWNTNELISSQKISVLDYPISEIDQILSPQGVVKDFIERFGAKRIVVDSVYPIGLHYDDEKRNTALIKFVNTVKSWGVTVILIASEVNSQGFPKTTYGIERFTDGWIRLNSVYRENERIRTLEIMKMKGRFHSMKIYQFSINESGINLLGPVDNFANNTKSDGLGESKKSSSSGNKKSVKKSGKKRIRTVHQKYKV